MKKSELKEIIIEKINKILTESKQVGTLYHFTPINNIQSILTSKILYPNSEEEQISTSRRPDMVGSDVIKDGIIVRISLDGDKISNKYKIRPFNYGGGTEDEQEEQIVVNGKNFPLFPYLKRIDFFLNGEKKINDKNIFKLLKTLNIPYKIYKGKPSTNIPYTQDKTGNPKNINNIRYFNEAEMYYPDMNVLNLHLKQETIGSLMKGKIYDVVITIGESKQYPNHFLYAINPYFLQNFKFLNNDGEELNTKLISNPNYNNPIWIDTWKNQVNQPYGENVVRNIRNSYILIPKEQINPKDIKKVAYTYDLNI